MKKRILSMLVALCILVGIAPVTASALEDSEPNDNIPKAQAFVIGDSINGSIPEKSDIDWYKFTLVEAGRITLKMTSYMRFYSLSIYDAEGTQLWTVGDKEWDATAGMRTDSYEIDLLEGIYHIMITGRKGWDYTNSNYQSTGEYVLKTDYLSANTTESEPNNDIASSTVLPIYGTIHGQLAVNDKYDFYKLELPASGELILDISAHMQHAALILYDINGNNLWSDDQNVWDSSSGVQYLTFSHHLSAGIYYIRVSGDNRITNGNYGIATGNYSIKFEYINANANEVEPNNTIDSPQWIDSNKTMVGQIATNDRRDFFQFTLTRDMKLVIDFTSYMNCYALQLYNESGERVWYDDGNVWDKTAFSRHDLHEVQLSAGTFILCVTGDDSLSRDYGHYTGNYTFKLNTENPFADISEDAFYYNPVLWALENGITAGASSTTFNPCGSCLRSHVVTFLYRAASSPDPVNTHNPFSDVKSSDFFYKPVLWAVENSITSGISATQFGSLQNCNRAAVVTFLWRAAGCPEPVSTANPFTDVKTSDFFYKPVLWAVENGITAGLDATHFGPTADCNRAQVVTFLYRAYN